MYKLNLAQKRIDRIYHPQNENLYSFRFYQDLCSGYSFALGDRNSENPFIYFEPTGCTVEKIFKKNYYFDISYELEQVVCRSVGRLLKYGKAYLYLQPQYTQDNSNEKNDSANNIITGMKIEEIFGFPIKKKRNKIIFYEKCLPGNVRKKELVSDRLIELKLRDLGFRKSYFTDMVKRLGKFDIISASTKFSSERTDGYDFDRHKKYSQINILKTSKEIGWNFGTEGLSDSYYLYKKIQQNKLKLKILNYIIEKINIALKTILDDPNAGKIIIQLKNINYDKIWNDYNKGRITGTELYNLLFH